MRAKNSTGSLWEVTACKKNIAVRQGVEVPLLRTGEYWSTSSTDQFPEIHKHLWQQLKNICMYLFFSFGKYQIVKVKQHVYICLTDDSNLFTHLLIKRMIWWVNKTTSRRRLQRERTGQMSSSDDWGNHNNIGRRGTYGSSRTFEAVILAGDNPRCDTDGAQLYPRQRVTDKWGAARGALVWHNKEDDSLSLQVRVQPTICEVRRVERQSAAQVLINPPASFEEVFALWTERKKVIDTR